MQAGQASTRYPSRSSAEFSKRRVASPHPVARFPGRYPRHPVTIPRARTSTPISPEAQSRHFAIGLADGRADLEGVQLATRDARHSRPRREQRPRKLRARGIDWPRQCRCPKGVSPAIPRRQPRTGAWPSRAWGGWGAPCSRWAVAEAAIARAALSPLGRARSLPSGAYWLLGPHSSAMAGAQRRCGGAWWGYLAGLIEPEHVFGGPAPASAPPAPGLASRCL